MKEIMIVEGNKKELIIKQHSKHSEYKKTFHTECTQTNTEDIIN